MKKLLCDYVPRHLRLGVCCDIPEIEMTVEVREDLNVVNDSKRLIQSSTSIKVVPVSDYMRKYKLEQFRLSNLIAAGVPLKVVNINHSNVFDIDQLNSICQRVDGAEKFVEHAIQQQQQRDNWFNDLDNNVKS